MDLMRLDLFLICAMEVKWLDRVQLLSVCVLCISVMKY
jgi:hypothetical protein